MSDSLSFYFNFDYKRVECKRSAGPTDNDNETYVKQIVNAFYNQNLGKIVRVTDMKSDTGIFFIVTFNKETWNWSNPIATKIYEAGFVNTEIQSHTMINNFPVSCESDSGYTWELFLISFPNFNINNTNNSDLIGVWTYDIMWNIQEYGEEGDMFEITKRETKETKRETKETKETNEIISDVWETGSSVNILHSNKEDSEKWKHWGGDNTWRYDEFGQDETTARRDWGEEPTEYRYDLTYMMYDQDFPSLGETKLADCKQGVRTENGYIVFNINEFCDYYGEEEGMKRWESEIYSAPCFIDYGIEKEPPNGCMFNYNISYLFLNICLEFHNENDFNMCRSIIRKYTDVLSSFTDPVDSWVEQKPNIKLRADYNNEQFNLSCWYTFTYTNLFGEKRQNIETIIKNFKSYDWNRSNMIDWIPSAN